MIFGSKNRNPNGIDPDAQLLAQIAKGEPQAAKAFVDRHLPSILGIAGSMLGDAGAAEDIAQEVFLKVWRYAKKWKPGAAKFQTWMHRVTMNLCYDQLRKKKEILTDAVPEQVDEHNIGADTQLIQNERTAQIQAALSLLAPRQCAAITLCYYQELGNIEAANVMQISVEALESLLARGRKSLREKLNEPKIEIAKPMKDGANK